MMDHYEELGIERSASVAEIRQAYRRLMQLLHPDHCGDDSSRRLAELQTKRLNAILAVLTDPVERQRYDRELSIDRNLPAIPASRKEIARAPAWLWPVALAAALLALVSQMLGPPRGVPASEPAAMAARPAPPPTPPARKSASVTPRPPQPSPASARLAVVPGTADTIGPELGEIPVFVSAHATPENPPASRAPAVALDPPALAEPVLGEPPAPPEPSGLAGEWLFVSQPSFRNNGLYPPEFIELRVTEDGGWMRGKYRARYEVPDRAISPAVSFEFEGRASRNEACLPWAGPGGSRGQVTLRLLPAGSLEVTWVVSHLGTELGLVSGTATLIRKEE